MQIDTDFEVVRGFCDYWKLAADWPDSNRVKYSKTLRADLAASLVQSATEHGGQLILTYHKFLTMVPSGSHSFAHGSGTCSKNIYWVTLARLPGTVSLERTKESSRPFQVGRRGPTVRLFTPERFFLPVRWKRQLLPVYLGASSRPRFTLERPDKKPADSGDDKLLNVGELGEHLFRVGPAGKLDWATKIFVVIGTRSVKAWLTEYGVSGMYEKIRSQTEFR